MTNECRPHVDTDSINGGSEQCTMIWVVAFLAVLLRGPRGPLHFNLTILLLSVKFSCTIADYKVALQCSSSCFDGFYILVHYDFFILK